MCEGLPSGRHCALLCVCAVPGEPHNHLWFSPPSRGWEVWSLERLNDWPRATGQVRIRKQKSQKLNPGAGFQNPSSEPPSTYLLPRLTAFCLLFFAFWPQTTLSSQRSLNLTPQGVRDLPCNQAWPSPHLPAPHPFPFLPLPSGHNGYFSTCMGEKVREKIQQEPELHQPHPPPRENQLLDMCWLPECFNQELWAPCSA